MQTFEIYTSTTLLFFYIMYVMMMCHVKESQLAIATAISVYIVCDEWRTG